MPTDCECGQAAIHTHYLDGEPLPRPLCTNCRHFYTSLHSTNPTPPLPPAARRLLQTYRHQGDPHAE